MLHDFIFRCSSRAQAAASAVTLVPYLLFLVATCYVKEVQYGDGQSQQQRGNVLTYLFWFIVLPSLSASSWNRVIPVVFCVFNYLGSGNKFGTRVPVNIPNYILNLISTGMPHSERECSQCDDAWLLVVVWVNCGQMAGQIKMPLAQWSRTTVSHIAQNGDQDPQNFALHILTLEEHSKWQYLELYL